MQTTIAEQKTEHVIAQTLNMELKHKTSRLSQMRDSLNSYHEKQLKAPSIEKMPPKTTAPSPVIGGFAANDPREKLILDWAKKHYKSYQDIQHFPFDSYTGTPKISAGVVYLCLKKHSFLGKTESTEYRVMDAYFRHNGRLADICDETGLKVWIVAKTIENLGYSPRWQEYRESRYITKQGNFGIGAEAEFRRLVPSAVDMNEDYKENNPAFDFIVNDKTVDIKEATLVKRRTSLVWDIHIKATNERPDFYCLFLCLDKEKRAKGDYHLLLIPKEALPESDRTRMLNISGRDTPAHRHWFQFEVDPAALGYMLGEDDVF